METAAEEPSYHAADPEAGPHDDPNNANQDDEFDFEIGGDDDLDGAGETDALGNDPIKQAHGAGAHSDDSYTYQPQEQGGQAPDVEPYHESSLEYGHDEIDLAVPVFDALGEADASAQDAQDDVHSGHEADGQDENEQEHVEEGYHEETHYDEATGEFDVLDDEDDAAQPELGQDHDLSNDATSVDNVHEGDDLQDFTHEAESAENLAEAETDAVQEIEDLGETAEDDETAGEYVSGPAQDASVAGDAENNHVDSDAADTSLAQDHHSPDAVDEPQDPSNWDAEDYEDDKDDHSNTFPNVTVSYQGQEYFLFAEAPDEDPNTYFLNDLDLIHQPLSQFLRSVREVISSEVEPSQEIFFQVDGLGLEFGQSTTGDFLDQTTFADVIQVNKNLVQLDGGSQSPELYIYLSVRSNPLARFSELVKGVEEGHGLSHFEKHYEDDSVDASATHEEEQFGFSRDVMSDDLSLDDANDEGEEVMSEAVGSHDVQQTHNPFRVDQDQQQPVIDTSVSGIASIDGAEHEINAASPTEAQASDAGANATAVSDGAYEGVLNGPLLDTTGINEASLDDTTRDGASISGELEAEIENVDVDRQDWNGPTGGDEIVETEEQLEVLGDFSQEGQEGTDDSAANAVNDNDYLDLGDDGDLLQPADHAETTNGDIAIRMDTSRQVSDNSSATATLDGEDSAHGDDAAVAPAPADPTQAPDQIDLETPQNDADEIDWNHDEDDEIGVAHQNPTDLSPSSLSVKRSRQEDEGSDGLGDESAAKRRRT